MTTPATEAPDSALAKFESFFKVAAIYDLVLGAAFLLAYVPVFRYLSIPAPENPSYLHLAAGFVFVQGAGFWFVARNPGRNVDLVKVGVMFKLMYVFVAGYALITNQLPHMVFAWFGLFDLAFAIMFARFLKAARSFGGATVTH